MAAEDTESTGTKGKSKTGMIIIIIVAVVVLLAVGVGAFLYMTGSGDEDILGGSGEGKVDEHEAPGTMYPLERFTVNLAPPDNKHYLAVSITLEISGGHEEEGGGGGHGGGGGEPKLDNEPKIRDKIITVLTSKRMSELQLPDGKSQVKAEIQKTVEAVLQDQEVKGVYFTEFTIQ